MSSVYPWLFPVKPTELLTHPRRFVTDYLDRFQLYEGIEFTPEARDLFFDAFLLMAEAYVQISDRSFEALKADHLQREEELEARLGDEEARHAQTRHDLVKKAKEDAEEAQKAHDAEMQKLLDQQATEIKRLKMEHAAEIMEMQQKHSALITKLQKPQHVTVDGSIVLVRKRPSPTPPQANTAWTHLDESV